MTLKQFYVFQEETFDSFCKRLIRNASADAHKKLSAQAARETMLSALSSSDHLRLSAEDEYHPYTHTFLVHGQSVCVYDWHLGQALQHLTPQRRNIILLFYFLGHNEPEIGRLLRLKTGTVHYRHNAALQHLREIVEVLDDER